MERVPLVRRNGARRMTRIHPAVALHRLVLEQRKDSFTEPEKASIFEALGIMCAHYCGWSSPAIFQVISAILEDSNFHTLNAQWHELIEEKEKAETTPP